MFTEFHKNFPARFRDWFFETDRDNLFILTFDKSAENIKAWIQSIAPYFKNVKTGAFETWSFALCGLFWCINCASLPSKINNM